MTEEEGKKWVEENFGHIRNMSLKEMFYGPANDKSDDEDDDIGWCGTVGFRDDAEKIQSLLDSGVDKETIISWFPKHIQILVRLFEHL